LKLSLEVLTYCPKKAVNYINETRAQEGSNRVRIRLIFTRIQHFSMSGQHNKENIFMNFQYTEHAWGVQVSLSGIAGIHARKLFE
jgi:hypothetical protein